jgi:NAD(P)-dependent dehydrogenase (short-subunit alcohol dehydrogenase family)
MPVIIGDSLARRRVLVTGGSNGTGTAITGRLTEGGATVMTVGDVESVTDATPTSFADFDRRYARYWRGQS